MPKALKATVLALSGMLGIFIIAGGMGVRASSNNSEGAYRQLGVYSEVLQRIKNEYVEEPNIDAVTSGALHGLLESLDPNSSYLSPAEYKSYLDHKSAQGNIGVVVSKRFGYATLVSVIPGGPADRAGLEPGTILESIDGRNTRELPLEAIKNLLTGQPGSATALELVRPRKVAPEKLSLQRVVVATPSAVEKNYEGNSIGYINPETLTKGKAEEIANRIKSLQHNGAKKLILDLRNVANSDIDEGVAVANLFLDHGMIAYLEGQKFPRQTFNADPKKDITSLPLVVLINRSTAGGAEIVASAILANNRGDVVGEKSFGDASVQKLIEVGDGSAVILSIAKYYSADGKSFQDNAVTPNIFVASDQDNALPDDEDQTETPNETPHKNPNAEDEPLDRAIQILKQKAA